MSQEIQDYIEGRAQEWQVEVCDCLDHLVHATIPDVEERTTIRQATLQEAWQVRRRDRHGERMGHADDLQRHGCGRTAGYVRERSTRTQDDQNPQRPGGRLRAVGTVAGAGVRDVVDNI